MQIRSFQSSDQEDVIALWTSVFGYPAPHNNPLEIIRHKLSYQSELFFVATENDRLVGTIMGGYDGHRGWIYSLAVVPEARRHGIGRALVEHLEAALEKLDCPKINLQILPSNAGVVEFYKNVGYRVEDRISMGKIAGA